MLKSLMLAGLLAAAAEGPSHAEASTAAAAQQPRAAGASERSCFDPVPWLPGTLQIEEGGTTADRAEPLSRPGPAPNHADCALV